MNMPALGKPIAKGDVLLNKETTSGILNPHSISKLTSLNIKATRAARTKPGNKPRELTLLKKLFFSARTLNGSENVVITQRAMATVIEIGCSISLSISVTKT